MITEKTTIICTWTYTVYAQQDLSYCIIKCKDAETDKQIVLVGSNLFSRPKIKYQVTGEWCLSKSGAKQFKVDYYEVYKDSTKEGFVNYVSSLKAGVGRVKAVAIFDKFGESSWEISRNFPERIATVHGVGLSTAKQLRDSILKHEQEKDIILLFNSANVSLEVSQANAIMNYYHSPEALDSLKENPYELCGRIDGLSFEKLDILGEYLHIPADNPDRIKAYTFKALFDDMVCGNACMPLNELEQKMESYLHCEGSSCTEALKELYAEGRIKSTNKFIYTKKNYEQECAIASEIQRLEQSGSACTADIDSLIADYERKYYISLADSQKLAVKSVFEEQLTIITGGPGTGKTTVTKAVLYVHKRIFGDESDPVLLAPTGKAARRMSEATGHYATTIHMAVGYRGEDEELDSCEILGNIVIIDEASMMDMQVASILLSKIQNNAKVVFVGDPQQLPSVGCGNVLADMIASNVIRTTKLNVIYRQSAENPIVANAHAINEGKTDLVFSSSFKMFECEDQNQLISAAVTFYERCVKYFGMDNVILLNPQRNNTEVSVDKFNKILQEHLNPHTGNLEMVIGSRTFRIGDRVMQLKNCDAAKNGDTGYIRNITKTIDDDGVTYEAYIEFNDDSKSIKYTRDDMKNVDLAYCCTVHKSQGSEYQNVIMVVSKDHPTMLKRNLVYTGITRAKKNICIFGQREALNRAIRDEHTEVRHTNLVPRLRAIKSA